MNFKFWEKKKEVKKSFNLSSSGNWIDLLGKGKTGLNDWKTSWVNTACSIRAENMAKAKTVMYKRKGNEAIEVENHSFIDLINGTNSYEQSWFEMIYLITLSLDIYGKAFIYSVAGTKGLPAEFRFLAPFAMKAVLNAGMTGISHYEYSSASGVTKYATEEIIFFKLPNLGNPFDGVATIKSCENIIEVDNIQSLFQKKYTLTGGNINEVIISDEIISDEEIERLNQVMEEKHSIESDSTWLLLQKMKYEKVNSSAKDLDFINGKNATRDEILSKLRVPKILAGLGQNSNRATANAELWSFIENVVKPFSKFIVDKLNIFIARTYGKEYYIVLEWKDIRDSEQILGEFKEGLITESEARTELGWSSDKPTN